MNFILIILLSCVLSLLSGCASIGREHLFSKKEIKTFSITSSFKIKIPEVECRLCAQDVERIFSYDFQYYGVKYVYSLGDFENGYLKCCLARGGHNIDLFKMIKDLKTQEFVPTTIEGQFIGSFKENDEQRVFELHDQEVTLLVSNDCKKYKRISDIYWQQLVKDKCKRIKGKIVFSDDIWWISI